MSTLREDLLAVKALIATEETWTWNTLSTDANYRYVRANDPRACRWCLAGAICKVADLPHLDLLIAHPIFTHLRDVVAQHPKRFLNEPITVINDIFGFKAVHQLLDLAIEAAK